MKSVCFSQDAYFSFTLLTVPETVIESWMDVIMICCQSLGPDQTDEGVCMPSQLLLAMNGSWLTRVASLSNTPYLLCISDAGSPWITVLAPNNITIFHLYTCITETYGQLDLIGKSPGKLKSEMIKTVQVFLSVWEYTFTHICIFILQTNTYGHTVCARVRFSCDIYTSFFHWYNNILVVKIEFWHDQ